MRVINILSPVGRCRHRLNGFSARSFQFLRFPDYFSTLGGNIGRSFIGLLSPRYALVNSLPTTLTDILLAQEHIRCGVCVILPLLMSFGAH